MTTDELRLKYWEQTKGDITYYSKEVDDDLWTDEYVLWMEKQLILTGVVSNEVELCECDNEPLPNRTKKYICGKCFKARN